MLKKVMKYDLLKMFKLLIWFYGITIIVSGIARIFGIWDNIQAVIIIGAVFKGLTYSAIATVLVNTFIHILMRISTAFFKDQSYLTHTLPVKKNTLLLSKYLSSLIVIVSSIAVCFLSLFILFYSPAFMNNIKIALESIVKELKMSSGTFILLLLLVLFSQVCCYVSMGITAIIKGYSFNHHRGVLGFAYCVIYYFIYELFTVLLAVIVFAISGNISSLLAEKMSQEAIIIIIAIAVFTNILFAVGFYFVSKKLFNKGVNVD